MGNRDNMSWNPTSCSLQNEEVMCFDDNQMLESKIDYMSLCQHNKILPETMHLLDQSAAVTNIPLCAILSSVPLA